MKKLYILIALTSLFFVQSCDKFLDLKPENIEVVSTVEDYRDILASYMRLLKTVNGSQKPVLGGYFLYPSFNVASTFAYRRLLEQLLLFPWSNKHDNRRN